MAISLEKGVWTTCIGLAGGGAVVIAPSQLWIGYSLISAAVLLLLWGFRIDGKHIWQKWWRVAHSPSEQFAGLVVLMKDFCRKVFDSELTEYRAALLVAEASEIERQMERIGIIGIKVQSKWNTPTLVHKYATVCLRLVGPLVEGDKSLANKIMAEMNEITEEAERAACPQGKGLDAFDQALDDIQIDRVPFSRVRSISSDFAINLNSKNPAASNAAYDIEGLLRQAAVDGELKVWGRKYRGPVRDNDPLVEIPVSHFKDYGFRHGVLHYDAPNIQSHTGTMGMAVEGVEGIRNVTFYDLHLSYADTRKILARYALTPAWTPLHGALRYLVYETDWSAKQAAPSTEVEFNRIVGDEFLERLARGEIKARGKRGWSDVAKERRTTEPIPADWWTTAFMMPHAQIVLADDDNCAVGQPNAEGYRYVIVDQRDVERVWPRRKVPHELSRLAMFCEPLRLRIARAVGAGSSPE